MLFYTHPAGLEHDTGPGHPERRARLEAVLQAVDRAGLAGLERREAPLATRAQIGLVHPESFQDQVAASIPARGLAALDGDTIVSPGSFAAAARAVGAAIAATDAVLAGEAKIAFCATRPPGHHAEPRRAMGFCLFNQIAIAAVHARRAHGVGRIAIVDFDVHHGNGTQAAFWEDPETLYISTHQDPLFPYTGAAEERGAHGTILNLPLPAGTAGPAYRSLVTKRLLPELDRFAPELLLISAGFDAHRADPLASLMLDDDDFGWITGELRAVAEAHAKGRVVSTLEGGYDTQALARSTVAHLQALG